MIIKATKQVKGPKCANVVTLRNYEGLPDAWYADAKEPFCACWASGIDSVDVEGSHKEAKK